MKSEFNILRAALIEKNGHLSDVVDIDRPMPEIRIPVYEPVGPVVKDISTGIPPHLPVKIYRYNGKKVTQVGITTMYYIREND